MSLPPVEPARGAPDVRLFLVGDAGGDEQNPLLSALQRALAEDSARSFALFLGDNIYPNGLPGEGALSRPRAESRMRAQIAAVRDAGARGLFIPGNHDWGLDDAAGTRALELEVSFVNTQGGAWVSMRPLNGCPGPEVVDVGSSLRLVVLDTEWWLRTSDSRGGCLPTDSVFLDSLGRAISTSGSRHVIVAGHHPLVSVGPHGGHFGWQQHLFPLQQFWSPLWVPLPVIGSLYPLIARARTSREDLRSRPYRAFRSRLDSLLLAHRPLAYAAGHEHNLQVHRLPNASVQLVSGSGSWHRASFVVPGDHTPFARRAHGFMRLDVWNSGPARLTVLTVDRRGGTCECFHMDIARP